MIIGEISSYQLTSDYGGDHLSNKVAKILFVKKL